MVADIVDIDGLLLAILDAGDDAANVRLADGARAERSRVRQQRLEELDGDDLLAVEFDRRRREHADVLKALHVRQIALAERHEEADALDLRQVAGQRLDLLVVQQIHVLPADLREIILAVDGHGGNLDPMAVLPVGAGRRDLAEVDLRVEVRGEGIAMVAAVAVENIKIVLLGIGDEHGRDTRVKAGAEQARQTGLAEALVIGPLPRIVKVGGEAQLLAALFVDLAPCGIVGVLRLVICGVDIVHAALEAGLHHGKVLIRQGQIQHGIRADVADKHTQRGDVIGVDLGRGDGGLCLPGELFLQGVALRLCAAGEHELRKQAVILTALLNGDLCNAAAANDQ